MFLVVVSWAQPDYSTSRGTNAPPRVQQKTHKSLSQRWRDSNMRSHQAIRVFLPLGQSCVGITNNSWKEHCKNIITTKTNKDYMMLQEENEK